MKTKLLTTLLTGSLFAVAANAQVDVTITGSTSFRSITINRAQSLFDAGSLTTLGNPAGAAPGGTLKGTMSNAVPGFANTPVTLRLSFSGSASGMLTVDGNTPIPTVDPNTGNTSNRVPDIALSDVFPESATPPIDGGHFDRSVIGVIPFVWVKNNGLSGITNITREQAVLLMTASGIQGGLPGMPSKFLGGSSTNPVWLIGRDSGSGTRITVHKDIGFTGTPTYWETNGAGAYIVSPGNGYSSGALQRQTIAGKSDAIGYLGEADALAIAGAATVISYEGISFSHTNVAIGQYPIWGYEHLVNRAGGLSASQQSVRNALISAITEPGFQGTNTLYTASFVSLSDMRVERGTDGATIFSTEF